MFENKDSIRKEMFKLRSELTDVVKSAWDLHILEALLQTEAYKKATVIFTYIAFEGEVDTLAFIQHALSDQKKVCVPRVHSIKEGMDAFLITDLTQVKKGFYGISEPLETAPLIQPQDIDLVIVPGVAFDRQKGRVGYGGGFYDRYLRRTDSSTPRIALAYDFQLLDSLPLESYDERVSMILTNKDILI